MWDGREASSGDMASAARPTPMGLLLPLQPQASTAAGGGGVGGVGGVGGGAEGAGDAVGTVGGTLADGERQQLGRSDVLAMLPEPEPEQGNGALRAGRWLTEGSSGAGRYDGRAEDRVTGLQPGRWLTAGAVDIAPSTHWSVSATGTLAHRIDGAGLPAEPVHREVRHLQAVERAKHDALRMELDALRQPAAGRAPSGVSEQMLRQERRLREAAEQQSEAEWQLRQQVQQANAQLRAEIQAKGVAQQRTQQTLRQSQEVQQTQHRQLEAAQRQLAAAQQQLTAERARCADLERTNARICADTEAQVAALEDERRQRLQAQQQVQQQLAAKDAELYRAQAEATRRVEEATAAAEDNARARDTSLAGLNEARALAKELQLQLQAAQAQAAAAEAGSQAAEAEAGRRGGALAEVQEENSRIVGRLHRTEEKLSEIFGIGASLDAKLEQFGALEAEHARAEDQIKRLEQVFASIRMRLVCCCAQNRLDRVTHFSRGTGADMGP